MMKPTLAVVAAGAGLTLLASGGIASAQSVFGDTRLSYQNGVVYDDDLVPGRGLNQSFLVGEQDQTFSGSGTVFSSSGSTVRAPSRNLIGSDGRAIDAIRRDRQRATAVNNIRNSPEF